MDVILIVGIAIVALFLANRRIDKINEKYLQERDCK